MGLLDGEVAFVTGAASGIGRSTAIRFAVEGAAVALADVPQQEEEGRKVVAEIERGGGRAIFVACDVSQPDQGKRAIDQTGQKFGSLNVVFANAGINGVWTPI